MSDTEKLLPCPWCGGDAEIEAVGVRWSIGCADADGECYGYQSLNSFARQVEAIAAWNSRHSPELETFRAREAVMRETLETAKRELEAGQGELMSINALIAKQVREGLNQAERARFLELTARRSMRRRPRFGGRQVIFRGRQAALPPPCPDEPG